MTTAPSSPPKPGKNPATDQTVLSRLESLKTMSVNELKEEWERLFATGAPNNSRSYLEIRIAYRIQELTHGGLSKKSRQMLKVLSAEMNGKRLGGMPRMLDDRKPIPGTRLIREWQGVTHVVTVQPDGFDYDGQRYKSLSKVANTITGKHWNGFAFFGLGHARKGGA